MSRQIQIRRGDVAANDNFIGAIGEVTMDTTNNTLRVHDGQTLGGTTLAKQSEIPDLSPFDYVVAWQMPTPENNYTWYRKYKSGWVEMGGRSPSCTSVGQMKIKFDIPININSTNVYATPEYISGESVVVVTTYKVGTQIEIVLEKNNQSNTTETTACARWYACGISI